MLDIVDDVNDTIALEIQNLLENGRLEEAKKIASKKEFENEPKIQCKMIEITKLENNIEEAKRIGYRWIFRNNAIIQAQMIQIALDEGDVREARRLAERKELKNYSEVQAYRISIAIKDGNLKKAARIANRTKFLNIPEIQYYRIEIAIMEGEYEEAKNIASREDLIGIPKIAEQLKRINSFLEKEQGKNNVDFLVKVLSLLRNDRIDLSISEEIKSNNNLTETQRTFLLLALYEKIRDIKSAKKIAKQFEEKNSNQEVTKRINEILQRMNMKKRKPFDYGYYDEILEIENSESELESRSESFRKKIKCDNIIPKPLLPKSGDNEKNIDGDRTF